MEPPRPRPGRLPRLIARMLHLPADHQHCPPRHLRRRRRPGPRNASSCRPAARCGKPPRLNQRSTSQPTTSSATGPTAPAAVATARRLSRAEAEGRTTPTDRVRAGSRLERLDDTWTAFSGSGPADSRATGTRSASWMAPCGHSLMQTPQPLHSSCLISALPASRTMASCGQRLRQTPQPVQRASSMVIMGRVLPGVVHRDRRASAGSRPHAAGA
jgi:hypothetical protein